MTDRNDLSDTQFRELRARVATLCAMRDGVEAPTDRVRAAVADLETVVEEIERSDEQLRHQNDDLLLWRERLEAERLRYREFFESATDGYLVTDLNGIVREANPAASHLLGVSRDYLDRKPLFVFVPLPERSRVRRRLVDVVRTKAAASWHMSVASRHSEPREVSVTVAPVDIPTEASASLRWIVRPVVDRATSTVSADIAAVSPVEHLGGVAHQPATVAAHHDRFLATVARDLKNPLQIVRDQLDFLGHRLEFDSTLDRVAVTATLGCVDTFLAQTLASLDEVDDLVQLRSGLSLDLRPQPADLADILCRLVVECRRTTELHRVEIDFDESIRAPLIGVWDESRVERALRNLLTGAIRRGTPESAVVIVVRRVDLAGAAWAEVRIVTRGAAAASADDQWPVSEVYPSFPRGRILGELLGFHGTRSIVEQHGGSLAIENPSTDRVTVTVRLPLSAVGVAS